MFEEEDIIALAIIAVVAIVAGVLVAIFLP